jgi:hypothetical protein
LLPFSSVRGLAQAPVPEKVFEGANGLRIHVKEVAPGAQPSSVQIICYLKHRKTGDTTLAAVSDFDRDLGGVVRALRDNDQFEVSAGDALFQISEGSIKANAVLRSA